MHILSIEAISKNYGIRPLFENVSLGLDSQDRIGVVGVNGSGKTTLLRLIAGEESPDTGRIVFAEDVTVGYLPQNPPFEAEQTVLDAVFAASTVRMKLLHDYEYACQELASDDKEDQKLLNRVSELAHELEVSGAWELETNARLVLSRLGIHDTAARMGTLSGGERKRVALAHALIENPDLLILDEPTNHLDAEIITWLEAYLGRYRGALLLVTHDRYFLDRVTSRILEIDRSSVQSFQGNYAYYLEKKEEQETARAVEGQKRDSRRHFVQHRVNPKARIDRAESLMAQPKETLRAELDISVSSSRTGKKVLELHNITKSYDGRVLLDGFSYILKPGDRIGIIGPNGAGKTTLFRIITKQEEPDRGDIQIGETVQLAYVDQSRALDSNKSIWEEISGGSDMLKLGNREVNSRAYVGRFNFSGSDQQKKVGMLSGGERNRVHLAKMLKQGAKY